ncbi:MAG: hypothetical protein SO256_09810, partial [Gemmiger sp.]|uniref:hypothetical protein n=1 Tax=Gemmiger sp. TaxID=2049027 RepID=UPI002A8334EA
LLARRVLPWAQPLIKCAASSGSRASNARPYMRNPAKQRPAWGMYRLPLYTLRKNSPPHFVILMNCKTGVDNPKPPCYNDDVETDMSACKHARRAEASHFCT